MDNNTELQASLNQITQNIFELLRRHERPNMLTAADQVYEWIWKQQIFLPGKISRRLSDVTLSAKLKISRTPVRQALNRLAHEGLVQFDPRRGYWTHVITLQDIKEIYELYEANEQLALRLAIPNLKKEDLQSHLETVYFLRTRFSEPDNTVNVAFCEAYFLLQNLINISSGNTRLVRYLGALRNQITLLQINDIWCCKSLEVALNEHENFLKALLEGKNEQAICLCLSSENMTL